MTLCLFPTSTTGTFQDLVDEAKRLIPTKCPEWTNHNLTDPGVALIELFAWMTELSLFRLNQVPDMFYTHMLNMLGFEPFPATAARTDLTFWLVDVVDEPVVVPAGTQVSTTGDIGAPQRVHHADRPRHHPAGADGRAGVAGPRLLRRRVGRAAPAQPGRHLLPADTDDARRPLLPRLRATARRQRDPHDDRRQRRGHRRDPDQAAAALGGVAGSRVDPGHRVPRHHRRPQPRRADHAARPAGPRAADAGRPAGVLDAGASPGAGTRAADLPDVAADPPDPRRLDRRIGDLRAQQRTRPARSSGPAPASRTSASSPATRPSWRAWPARRSPSPTATSRRSGPRSPTSSTARPTTATSCGTRRPARSASDR